MQREPEPPPRGDEPSPADPKAGFPPPAAPELPSRLRPSLAVRVALTLVGAVTMAAAAGAVALWQPTPRHVFDDLAAAAHALALFVAFAVGAWLIAAAHLTELRTGREALVLRRPLGARRIRLPLRAVRVRPVAFGWDSQVLWPADRHQPPVRLPLALAPAGVLSQWLAQWPDADRLEGADWLRHVDTLSALGPDTPSRRARLERVSNVLDWLQPVLWTALFAAALWPHLPRQWVWVQLVLPWALIAAVLASRGVLRLGGSRLDPRPDVMRLWLLALVTVLPRVLLDLNLVDIGPPVWAGVSVALAVALFWWPRVPRAPRLPLPRADRLHAVLWPALGAGVYAASAAVWVNVQWDTRVDQSDATRVSTKSFSGGKTLRLYLRLEPWGRGLEEVSLNVPPSFFNAVSPGEPVCVRQRPGWLGWRWTDVALCAEDGGALVARGARPDMPDAIYRALRLEAHGPERRGERLRLLAAGDIDPLEASLQRLQGEYRAGRVSDQALLEAYRDFYDPDPDLDAAFDAWIARYPQSYPAWLARGVHRKFQAEALYGAGFVRWVSPSVNADMAIERQRADLEHSLTLDARPTLSYLHLSDIAGRQRDPKQLREWLDRGLAVDPAALALRRKYLVLLSPGYGGSMAAVEAYIEETRRAGAPPHVVASLEARSLALQADAANNAGDRARALDLLQAALERRPAEDEYRVATQLRGVVLVQSGRYAEAVEPLRLAAGWSPLSHTLHAWLGYALLRSGAEAEALPSLRRADELGSAWARGLLGRQIAEGKLADATPESGIAMVRDAARRGDEESRRWLRQREGSSR